MRVETIYENKSLYRDSFLVQGYRFGTGEKSLCIMGSMRGNEYQQVYACTMLLQKLKQAEENKLLIPGHEILVIPCANPYSMNIEKRFWPIDNTDINRMFPGYNAGETTQRIAAGIFEQIKDYQFGVQFASYYMPGEFMPHINIMKTGFEDVEVAKRFGMPYVVLRHPRPYDTTTLNYNWQIWETQAFSLYTTTTAKLNPDSAERAVASVLNFMRGSGLLLGEITPGIQTEIVDDDQMLSLRAPEAGFFLPQVQVEEHVEQGALLATIRSAVDGEIISQLHAPRRGVVFFMHDTPMTYAHTAVIKMILD